ncbi:zinc finger protein 236-like [Trichogramma pretiosum]|uniref:zinc finger protein 236-like n=1 Tax=Trichogramma pretiosum TaxID=7493 RepID=UPI000C71C84F|nr:zinc finger protein 236-like [Trichogramma pretiosum]
MEPSDKFNNCAIRVKEEPSDESPDLKNFPLLPFPPDNSIQTIKKCEENLGSELDDEVEIIVECEDVKPSIRPLTVMKIENCSEDHLAAIENGNEYLTQNIIKSEALDAVKKESLVNDVNQLNMNSNCRISEPKKRRVVMKNLNHNHPCDRREKTFSTKRKLTNHIDVVHTGIKHKCDKCGKKFTTTHNLKVHIESMHNGVTHACDTCRKTFKHKTSLRTHIDTTHKGIKHKCSKCKKTFTTAKYLKCHIESMHNGVTPTQRHI